MTVLDVIDQFNVGQGTGVKRQTNQRLIEGQQVVHCSDGSETLIRTPPRMESRTKVRTFNSQIALLSNYNILPSSASSMFNSYCMTIAVIITKHALI